MIVVVGANGFVGRHLVARALACGTQVCVVVREGRRENFKDLGPNCWSMSIDEFLSQDGRSVIKDATAVVSLMSQSVPATNSGEPWLELHANVEPFTRLVWHVASVDPSTQLIFLSSGGTVYGAGHEAPISETAPLAPISPYGVGKVCSEAFLEFVSRTSGMPYSILRVGNPIGVWQTGHRHQGIVAVTIERTRRRQPIHVFDGGLQMRDYLDADELADCILAVVEQPAGGRILNVGSGVGTSTLDVVQMVGRVMGQELDIRYEPARPTDVRYAVLNCDRAKATLGWHSRIGLEETIARVLAGRKVATDLAGTA